MKVAGPASRRATPLLAALVAFAILFSFVPAGAQSEEEQLRQIEQEIGSLRDQIEAAQQTRTEYGRQLAATQERMNALLVQLDEAQSALDTINNHIAAQEEVLAELGRKIELLTAELAATRVEQRATRDTVQDRAVDLYMNGVFGAGSAVFAVDDGASLSVGYEYAENLLQDTEILLRSLEVLEIQEERQQALLEEEQTEQEEVLADLDLQRVEAEAHKAELDGIHAEIDAELAAQRSLLSAINGDIAVMEDHMAGLEESYAALEREIAARSSGGGSNPGILAYPVSAPITSPFGNRVHPITGTVRLHKGVDFGAAAGTPIRAAGAGTVILAEWFGGFGNAVVIDHGGGLTTLYAHQSGLNVSRGQAVATGDTVGWVGSTGFSTGPHLHFETRENGVAVNPLNYLNG